MPISAFIMDEKSRFYHDAGSPSDKIAPSDKISNRRKPKRFNNKYYCKN